MMSFLSYEYSILRYVHDTTTGEFINVGVVLYSKPEHFIGSKFRTTISRISAVFPDANKTHLRKVLKFIGSRFEDVSESYRTQLALSETPSFEGVIHSILPKDDSSLQWSPISSGITIDFQEELNDLFSRYVTKYDSPQGRERRTEQDIWKDFEKTLTKFSLSEKLEPKKISVQDDEIEFKHAWKNGVWHCIEPVSFDLSTGEYLRDKAHRWLGQMSSIQQAKDRFKLYLLLSPPSDTRLNDAFSKAISILKKMPIHNEIYLETESQDLALSIFEGMQSHKASQNMNSH